MVERNRRFDYTFIRFIETGGLKVETSSTLSLKSRFACLSPACPAGRADRLAGMSLPVGRQATAKQAHYDHAFS
jgi:hypothetical protein